jgi:hypothetical protein
MTTRLQASNSHAAAPLANQKGRSHRGAVDLAMTTASRHLLGSWSPELRRVDALPLLSGALASREYDGTGVVAGPHLPSSEVRSGGFGSRGKLKGPGPSSIAFHTATRKARCAPTGQLFMPAGESSLEASGAQARLRSLRGYSAGSSRPRRNAGSPGGKRTSPKPDGWGGLVPAPVGARGRLGDPGLG